MHALHPIPMAQDNYGWLIVPKRPDADGLRHAIVVDPTEAQAVQAALVAHHAVLGALCATHHHHDHTGGIGQLVAGAFHRIEVVAGAADVAACRIPRATVALAHGDAWTGHGVTLRALHVPGHTLGSTALYSAALGAVFVGDTLFAGGCGRLFEGDAEMMWRSMLALRALPGETLVCCGHEYTLKNLAFALSLEHDHAATSQALVRAQHLRHHSRPTVPTTMAQERAYNPFLRADDAGLMRRMGTGDAVETFRALRLARDNFTG